MEEMKQNNIEDEKFRKIFTGSKVPASENLKFRIMQQIETETALSRKEAKKSSFSAFKSMLSVFGVMYAIIGIVGFGIYFAYGEQALQSTSTYMLVILIASICSVFWMISVFDEKRRSKKHQHKE